MDQSKKRRWLHVPSPAMIVACVALFIAMGGTSYAAATLAANSVGTKQLKKNAVTSAKIKSAAVTAAKVKDGTLTGAKVKDGTLTGAKVQDGTLTGADLAAGAVDTTKIGTIPGARVSVHSRNYDRRAAVTSTVLSCRRTTPRLQRRRRLRPRPAHQDDGADRRQVPDHGERALGAPTPTGRRVVALNVNYPAAGWTQIARSSVSATVPVDR